MSIYTAHCTGITVCEYKIDTQDQNWVWWHNKKCISGQQIWCNSIYWYL